MENKKRSNMLAGKRARTARRVGARLAALYALGAAVWILVSDELLVRLGFPPPVQRFLNSAKGILFVFVTASLLYVLAYRAASRLVASQERHQRLFDEATAATIVYRVMRDPDGRPVDLAIEDVNPAMIERSGVGCERLVGARMSVPDKLPEEVRESFALVWEAATGRGPRGFELHLEESDTFVLASLYPLEGDVWASASTDITDLRRTQRALRHQEDGIRQAYVDVLDAVTGGRLVLITEQEIGDCLGEPITEEQPIASAMELASARATLRELIATRLEGRVDECAVLNASGEALNNALKHGGGGEYRLYMKDGVLQVAVSDSGPGIDFRTLPKATLLPGFSTIATLGMGFTIMLQLCDRVLIATEPGHTAVVLEIPARAHARSDPSPSLEAHDRDASHPYS